MINLKQLRNLVVEPVLILMDKNSESAIRLIIGTALVESVISKEMFIRQLPNGPARGLFGMEPNTHNWLLEYIDRYPRLNQVHSIITTQENLLDQLYTNLSYQVFMCRVKYLTIPASLPYEEDDIGIASYWKKYYNTEKGAGTVDFFLRRYLTHKKDFT